MDKIFDPEKYQRVVCSVCDGHGRIGNPDDVKVCQNCEGFGFIRKEEKSFYQKDKTIFKQKVGV
jgi:DnaJ-class molecular chaperone